MHTDKSGRPLTPQEITQLLQAIELHPKPLHRSRDHLLTLLFLYTGARRADLASLTWNHFQDNQLTYYNHKSKHPQTIILPPRVLEALNQYRLTTPPNQPHLFPSYSRNASKGKPLTDHALNRIFKYYGNQINLPNLSTRWFRHTCTSLALAQGHSYGMVSAHLGHREPKSLLWYLENSNIPPDSVPTQVKFTV